MLKSMPSALWIVEAQDGSGARVRLTACPGAVCDEHGVAWSPDGGQIAFVTTVTRRNRLNWPSLRATGVT